MVNNHKGWNSSSDTAGKHVLCEKPLVTTMRDFDRVESAAAGGRVVLFEGFMYLHHPQTVKVRELVQSGRLGRLRFIDSWFDYWLPEEVAGNIRLNKTLHGGSFWVFLKRDSDSSTTVYQVSSTTGQIVGNTARTGRTIVGAGVSTCAPIIIL